MPEGDAVGDLARPRKAGENGAHGAFPMGHPAVGDPGQPGIGSQGAVTTGPSVERARLQEHIRT